MKRILLTTATLCACLYFFVVKSYAQGEAYYFERLSEQHGLSHKSVWSIHQDKEGFMWFGTQEGLNKFDGYNFTIFRPDPNKPENTLQHNIVSAIHEDKSGRLWVGTFGGGLHQVDKSTGKITHYANRANSPFWSVVYGITEDHEGILWLSTGNGIARFDPNIQEFSLYNPKESTWFRDIVEDSSHRLWAGGGGGLYQIDRQTKKVTPITLDSSLELQPHCFELYLDKRNTIWIGTAEEGLFLLNTKGNLNHITRYNPEGAIQDNTNFHCIFEDNEGLIWIAGSEGLYRIHPQINKVLTFKSAPQEPGKVSHHKVSSIYQDKAGRLWFGTDNGVNKLKANTKKFHSSQIVASFPSTNLLKNSISDLLKDHTGKIWLGNAGKYLIDGDFRNGLYQLDPITGKFKHFLAKPSNPDSLISNRVWALHEDQKKRLWVGTTEALHLYDQNTGKFKRYLTEIPVNHITEDFNGRIWIGGFLSGPSDGTSPNAGIASFDADRGKFKYYKYNPEDKSGLPDWGIFDIEVSHTGDIWVALASAGISRLNPENNTFDHFPSSKISKQGYLNDKDVRSLYEDEQNILWVGTNQGGLHKLDPKTNKFTFFTMDNGLPSNHIVSITGDRNGSIWMGTSKGISRFNPKTKEFRNFDVNDGLPANEFRGGSVYARDGKLMFGSVNGFVIFDPDSIQDNTTVPPVYITGFQVMDEAREVSSVPIELAHDENFLSFDFVALNYDAPEKNQYAYMLEGVDKDWVYSNTRRFASYTNLDPGVYTFRVKASNNDGFWNEEGTFLYVTILPPWWQTGWAYALYIAVGLSLLYSLRQYTVKRERLKHELSIQRMEAEKMHEVDQLKSHFFANISHEFRTPLTLLLGPLDKLMTEPAYAKDHSLFSMMQRNAQRLLHLINQLLDLSKLEAGRMKAEVKAGALAPFLQSIGLSFTTLAERQQISYHFQYPHEHVVVYFDADKLEKIITNLLSNAFKFTPAGGSITFSALLHDAEKSITTSVTKPQNAHLSLLELKVQDSGVGMSEEQLAYVFHRFYQADTAQRGTEGSGIGLSLVRELVELHGGEVSATSEVGKGSCFSVKLPLWQASFAEIVLDQQTTTNGKEQLLPSATSGYETDGKSIEEDAAPLILVVEDNADVRAFIRENLQAVYQVMEAADGLAGYHQAIEHIPDLILSDVMMPKMDGVALCQKLKTNEKTAHIPLILLTAKASGGDKIVGLETGADDYIIKPFKADELLVRIKT